VAVSHYQWEGDRLKLKCKIQINAPRNHIVGVREDQLKIQINAPPVDGKANIQVLKLLSKEFGVAKQYVKILRGECNRNKLIEISSPAKIPESSCVEKQ